MQRKRLLSLVFLVAVSTASDGAIVWNVGRDDNQWNLTGTGGGPSTVFVQEQGVINPLPGNPTDVPTVPPSQSSDNDYYFSGVYSTVIPGNTNAPYFDYAPVGTVSANEEAAERAFAAADNDLRYHFNLTAADVTNNFFTVSFDALNLDQGEPGRTVLDPRYGIEIYFNNVLVMPQLVIRPGQLNTTFTTPLFLPATVNAQAGPGPDNIVSLRGINYNGADGGNWMGIDYVQLNSQPIPEPASAAILFSGALGLLPLLRRRHG